ncbi:MOSC domain-containing protein [Halobacterium salinarum]|uniref:MOSC domain-containing protein n=1 Tax=Halobacterium salinarum TaxID=2242 RepID=UPI001F29995F|nr:MOSC domain-containing protein [Halobacterium salinarum]MCF2206208.1 MOSC domain-containing protein [Halobacterium salinarum]
MAAIAGLYVYPIKGLDSEHRSTATLRTHGQLHHDRTFTLVDSDTGSIVTAKRRPALHAFRTDYEPETGTLTVTDPDGQRASFSLGDDEGLSAAGDWFDSRLAVSVSMRSDPTGFVDRADMGPAVVSTATLEAIADWFDSMTVAGARRRLRANIEIEGVPAFWEDRFVGDGAPAFEVGGVRFEGVTPCNRCVVPSRDPDTGEPLPEFRKTFCANRERTFPEWADGDAFDHEYAAMILARAPDISGGETLAVGDGVAVLDEAA